MNPKTLRTFKLLATGLVALAIGAGCASKPKVVQQKAAFWPQYPDEPRVQYLTSFQRSTDVEPTKTKLDELVMGKETQQVLPIVKPYGLDMWNGRIYVCDIRQNDVTVLDVRNKQTLVMGKAGTDPLERPTDIAIAPDGYKYVTDLGKGRVFVFDPQDRQVGSIGSQGMKPMAAAVFQTELYVCDRQTQSVLCFDRFRGTYLRQIGRGGPNDGQFIMPIGIDVDPQGFIYVIDVMKCQLQKFDRAGKLISKFGTTSANAGGFVRPKQMAVDKDGQIYVVDAAFSNVQIFDQQGRPLTFFGSTGQHPGAMYLPAGVCVHEGDLDLFKQYIHPAFQAERLILVTNQFGDNKISVYAFGKLAPGKTIADVAQSQGVVPSGVGDKRNGPAPLAPSSTAPSEPELEPAKSPIAGAAGAAPATAAPAPTAPLAPRALTPAQQQQQPAGSAANVPSLSNSATTPPPNAAPQWQKK